MVLFCEEIFHGLLGFFLVLQADVKYDNNNNKGLIRRRDMLTTYHKFIYNTLIVLLCVIFINLLLFKLLMVSF